MKNYGMELILDLHGCDVQFFNRQALTRFFRKLCDDILHIDREDLHFYDDVGVPPEECQTRLKTVGTSAVQFIVTSNVTIHTLDLLGDVYLNVFSCDDFSATDAELYAKRFFKAKVTNAMIVRRGVA